MDSLRNEQIALADQVTQEFLAVFGSLNFKNIDYSSPGFVEAAISVAERGHRAGARIGSEMYLSMRTQAGVAGSFEVVAPELDVSQLRRDLIALGPIAAKKLLSRGERIPDAAKSVFTLTAGRVATNALSGVRDTISATTLGDSQAVAYARQPQGDACDFCIMLADNTYRDAFSAMYSAGNRKRNLKPQPMGATFHDHCRCTLKPLFASQVNMSIVPRTGSARSFGAAWRSAHARGMTYDQFLKQAGLKPGY